MKKTYQMLITTLSLIIMLSITGSAFAQEACVLEWWTNESSWEECSAYMPDPRLPPIWECDSGTYDISGSKFTMETSKTQASTLEVYLTIMSNNPEGFSSSDCYYYNNQESWQGVGESVCLDGTWGEFSYYGTNSYGWESNASGGWTVICEDGDIDEDGVLDGTDNCPAIANPNQEDVDNNGIGDVCDPNTIYGTISGDVQEGIYVGIYKVICGVLQPYIAVITDAQGYYAIGSLANGKFLVAPPDGQGYSFNKGYWVDIPQTEIQSYDFIAHNLSFCVYNSDCNKSDYCFKEACADIRGACEVRPEYCPDNYDPVCGCNFITYSNACDAAGNGVSVAYMGECF